MIPAKSWLPVALSFGALFLAAFGYPSTRDGRTDFRSFYAGAKLAGTPHLYSASHAYELQRGYSPQQEVKPFIRPPFYAALIWPLGRLSYRHAHMLWQLLNIAAVAGFILLWRPRELAVPLCCFYFPLLISFISAQDIPLILLVFALAAFLLRKNSHFAAGAVFALCGAKAHVFLLLPLLIVARRLWKFAAGLAAGAAILLAVSWAVAGLDWPARYLDLLKLTERSEASQTYMPNLNGLLHRFPQSEIWLALAAAAVILGTWYVIRRSPLDSGLAFVLIGGLLVGMHGFVYDCALLLPLFLQLPDQLGWDKTLGLAMATGISTIALTHPSTAPIGQSALILLFCFLVYRASLANRRPSDLAGEPART